MQGWIAKRLADGAAYYPPEGARLGAITIRERRRPLERVRQIVEHDLGKMRETTLASGEIEESEQLITGEGEHAALFRIAGVSKIDGAKIEYMHAFVFGDDCYDRFDAWCTDSTEFLSFRISIRDVVFAHRLGLGRDRVRRFFYDPPTGWQGLGRNFVTEWYPSDYPRRLSRIVVGPAAPEGGSALNLQMLPFVRTAGFIVDREVGPEVVMSTYGLSGTMGTIYGHLPAATTPNPTEIKTVTFQDERFTYRLRLETTAADSVAANEVFAAVYKSARPVPYAVSRESDLWVAWDKSPV